MRSKYELNSLSSTANTYGINPSDVLTREELYELAVLEENQNTSFVDEPNFACKEQKELNVKQYIVPLENLPELTWKQLMDIKTTIIPVLTGDDDQKKFNLFPKGGMARFWSAYKLAFQFMNARKKEDTNLIAKEIKELTDYMLIPGIKEKIKNSRYLTKKSRKELYEYITDIVELGYVA